MHDIITKVVLIFDDLEKFTNSKECMAIDLMLTNFFAARFYEELYRHNLDLICINSSLIDSLRHYKNKSKKDKREIKKLYLSIDWYKKINKEVDEAIKNNWDKCIERRDIIVEFANN